VAGAVAAVALVATLIVVLVVRGLGSSSKPPQAGQTSAPASAGSPSPGQSGPGSPAVTVAVPAAFAGSWAGRARQSDPAESFRVRLTLAAGSAHGRVTYSGRSLRCSASLNARSAGSGTLTLHQRVTKGRSTCADGTITLTTQPGRELAFTFRSGTGPAATGTLRPLIPSAGAD
jgi:type IV secretory pathway TrbL component